MQIECKEQNAIPVLMVRTRANMATLPQVIGENYGNIMGYLNELGKQPADAPYTCYHNMDMEDLDVEMGFPVENGLAGKEDIQAGEIPAGKYVTAMYKGPYAGMQKPYDEMFAWMKTEGYEQTGVYYEVYYNSPKEVPEEELLTKIMLPVK
jgi:effector-binding domain-containing protein